MIKRILIDPGHGGDDPGAIADSIEEKNINLLIADEVVKQLKLLDYEIWSTRLADDRVHLGQRVRMQKDLRAQVFVSIHCDSFDKPEANGFTVFHFDNSRYGRTLADRICSRYIELGMFNCRGMKIENFYVLKYTGCPAVLVECGFISNEGDRKKLIDGENQKTIASAIALGINDYCLFRESEMWPQ